MALGSPYLVLGHGEAPLTLELRSYPESKKKAKALDDGLNGPSTEWM